MEPSSLTAVDTNVLVYSCYSQAPYHSACRALIEPAHAAETGLCVTPQIVAEFYAVVTNPNGDYRREPDEALDTLEDILAYPGITVLPIPSTVPARLIELAQRNPVRGTRIHDLQIAATILDNGP